jgi:hypothetical protein
VFAVFGLAVLDELAARRRAEEATASAATGTDAAVEPSTDRPAPELADQPVTMALPLSTPTPTPDEAPAADEVPTPDETPTPARTDGPDHEATGSAGERARS